MFIKEAGPDSEAFKRPSGATTQQLPWDWRGGRHQGEQCNFSLNNGALSWGMTFMYFSGSFATQPNSTCELFRVHQEKPVYSVYRFTITLCLAAGLQIILLKVAHELKIPPNTSNLMIWKVRFWMLYTTDITHSSNCRLGFFFFFFLWNYFWKLFRQGKLFSLFRWIHQPDSIFMELLM